jgi:hypothetical protein
MGLTGILEIAIGLIFVYSLVSMFCSGLNEFIAQELGRRGKFLREGLINIVGDRWIYLRMINHPLVSSLYRDLPGKPRTPSYIPAPNFVNALLDLVVLRAAQLDPDFVTEVNASQSFEDVRAAALKCKERGYTVGDAILPLLDAAQGNLDQARKNIAGWYESGMERVSGWYKKYTRRHLLAVGLLVAVLFNVDTLTIVTELSKSANLRKSLADAASQVVETNRFNGVPVEPTDVDVKNAQDHLKGFVAAMTEYERQGLPVGFSCLSLETPEGKPLFSMLKDCWNQTKREASGYWFLKILGWTLTGLAVSIGAPFWYDLLNKFVDLRGAGKKPEPVAKPS